MMRALGFLLSIKGGRVDKERKEALQVTKELVAKFIETRTVSPSNFGELFPTVYNVVINTLRLPAKDSSA